MPNWLASDQDSTILVYLATEDFHPNSCTTFSDLFLFSSLFFVFIKLYFHRKLLYTQQEVENVYYLEIISSLESYV